MALVPSSTGFETGGYLVAVVTVASAAREKPALERSGRRKAEANSLTVVGDLYEYIKVKERALWTSLVWHGESRV